MASVRAQIIQPTRIPAINNTAWFSFSDTIAGYVQHYNSDTDALVLTTSGGRDFTVHFTDTTCAEMIRNLGEPYRDCTGPMRAMLKPGQYLYAWGVFYPEKNLTFDAKRLIFVGRHPDEYQFERSVGGSTQSVPWAIGGWKPNSARKARSTTTTTAP